MVTTLIDKETHLTSKGFVKATSFGLVDADNERHLMPEASQEPSRTRD